MKQVKQYTQRSDYWNTPKKIYDHVLKLGYKDYNVSNSFIDPFYKDTSKYFMDKVFINPPFSILSKNDFIETIKQLKQNKNDILLLMPARTDTKYFHSLLELGFKVTFIKGRLKYNDSKKSAPFPSVWMRYDLDFVCQ